MSNDTVAICGLGVLMAVIFCFAMMAIAASL